MHKLFVGLLSLFLVLIAAGLLVVSVAKADSTSGWINSALALQKEADIQAVPDTLNSNIDCVLDDKLGCLIATPYGSASSVVRLRGSDGFRPVISYIDNKQHFFPVLNSPMAITYTTEPVYGLYLYFNKYFLAGLQETFVPGTTQKAWKMTQPPDGKLADKSNRRLGADTTSMSFSRNGQWMVVSSPNIAVLRVNLQTFEVLPFAPGFNYTIGIDPSPRTAISNDGRYAVVASKYFTRFKIYDLSTCGPVPDSIVQQVTCESRDLGDFMSQQVPGYGSIAQARFLTDDTLAIYAGYKIGTVSKIARFIISTGNISSQIEYLALGDSYISGEGAYGYQGGTDSETNSCHLSLVSYPYLIGRDLDYNSFHSVACSGAVIKDVTDSSLIYKGQADNRSIERQKRSAQEISSAFVSFKPGYVNQADFVSRYRPKTVMLSIGGNDIGFSDIVKKCAIPWNLDNCYESYEDRLELVRLINSKFQDLVDTYTLIKNRSPPDSRIYIIGYPQIAKAGGDCALNVHLSDSEAQFSQQLIDYLDRVIKAAADRVGVFYVDVQDALNDHRLCETTPSQIAMNGLTRGTDAPIWLFGLIRGPFGNESYHPNALGHQLLRNEVLEVTQNLTNPMPAPNPNAGTPAENGLEILNAPRKDRAVNSVQPNYDMTNDILFRGTSSEINVEGINHAIKPGNSYQAELHSGVINLGALPADSSGNINGMIQIPANAPLGLHTLHLYGTNLAGEKIDIFKDVYVAASADDYDGDGVPNADEACLVGEPSGQDYDQDGIDDACDGFIVEPPVQETAPTSGSSQQPPGNSAQNGVVLSAATSSSNQPSTPTQLQNAGSVASLNTGPEILASQNTPGNDSVLATPINNQESGQDTFGVFVSTLKRPGIMTVGVTFFIISGLLSLRRMRWSRI